jgi:hypothetical protein
MTVVENAVASKKKINVSGALPGAFTRTLAWGGGTSRRAADQGGEPRGSRWGWTRPAGRGMVGSAGDDVGVKASVDSGPDLEASVA